MPELVSACEPRPIVLDAPMARPENALSDLCAHVRELRESASGDDPHFWETQYRDAYAPISLDCTINDDGSVTFAPAEDGDCTLLGTAGLIERLIRNRVGTLQNVATGDGASTFKQDALALASLELVSFEGTSFGIRDNPAVVTANGVRYPPFDVDYGAPAITG